MVAFANSLGPLLVGVILNVALYGILIVQCTDYHFNFKRDPRWLKYLILFIFIVATLNTVFGALNMYDYFIFDFDNPSALLKLSRYSPANAILTATVACGVQLFFGFRVKRFTGNNWIFALIIVLSFAQFAGGLGSTIATALITDLTDLRLRIIMTILSVWIFSALTTDVVITSSLVWYLYHSRIGVAATDDVINKILLMVIQTGLLTTIWAGLDATLFYSLPHSNNAHLLFTFSLSNLYANSLMSNLNARARWERRGGNIDTFSGLALSSFKARPKEGTTVSLAQGDGGNRKCKKNHLRTGTSTNRGTISESTGGPPKMSANIVRTSQLQLPLEKDKIVDESRVVPSTPDSPEMEFHAQRDSEDNV